MLKRKDIAEGVIEKVDYPNRGRIYTEEGQKVTVKNTIPGQKIRFRVFKKHKDRVEGNLLELLEKSPLESREKVCEIFPDCGGCLCQTMPYEKQLAMKSDMVNRLLEEVLDGAAYDGILGSPDEFEYRNKMEFSFGDEVLDGPLTLGLHKRATTYTVLDADSCRLVHEDIRKIVRATLDYCKENNLPKYNKRIHQGFLRFLLVRRSQTTGELLVYLITSSQMQHDFSTWADRLRKLEISGTFAGIFHAEDDKMADAVNVDVLHMLYGKDYFYEELLGLKFKVTAFSFFQTNTQGAEVLYDAVRRYVTGKIPEGGRFAHEADTVSKVGFEQEDDTVSNVEFAHKIDSVREIWTAKNQLNGAGTDTEISVNSLSAGEETDGTTQAPQRDAEAVHAPILYDLYSGTGTIGQMLSPVAGHVYGVELIPEAVKAAEENAALNDITNCTFIVGDVLEKLQEIEERPDYIILDPPREGVNPRALSQIIEYGVGEMVYISCKASSFKKDMAMLREHGWRVKRWCLVDMFPQTMHVETVVLLSKGEVDSKKIRVEFSLEDMDMSEFQDGATYTQIKDYVLEHSGLKVSNLYISQIKRKCGIEVGKNYNLPKSEDSRQPLCPPEKEKAIREAFKYFGII